MASQTGYCCTACGKLLPKEDVTVKKVLFSGVGTSSTVFRSRTTEWLCDPCLGKDKDYNFPRDTSRAERMRDATAKRKAKSIQEEAGQS